MKKFLHRFVIPFASLVVCLVVFVIVTQVPQTQAARKTLRTFSLHSHKPVCGKEKEGKARCHAQVTTNDQGLPLVTQTLYSGSLGPVQFHTAYSLPCTPGGIVQSICTTPSTFGPTIAIVDAYAAPTIENDLQVYSSQYGLPSCTKANGCLKVVDQNGGTTYPVANAGWAFEASLDVQVAHAICQTCKLLLVETNSNSLSDLAQGVSTAAALGAVAISNSYGASEWSTETAWDAYYNHPGVAVTASAGDNGYGAEYPAASPNVVAVGGTTLQIYTDNTYANETVWNGTGSGCSLYESANTWQSSLSNWSLTGCATKRAIADVSADADPNTGAAVYDSTPYQGSAGWWQVGGTSLASPLIAGMYALGVLPTGTNAASVLYANYAPQNFHDVASGTNGVCTTTMCAAGTNYDGPTGLGTPNGLGGFGYSAPVVTDTPTPSLSLSPTATPTATPTPTVTPTPLPTNTPTPTPVLDTTPPTVVITSPTNGALVPRQTLITVTANASDNIGVTRVDFYRNNNRVCLDTTPPYSCNMNTGGKNTTITYKAIARDARGNTATSTVTVHTQ